MSVREHCLDAGRRSRPMRRPWQGGIRGLADAMQMQTRSCQDLASRSMQIIAGCVEVKASCATSKALFFRPTRSASAKCRTTEQHRHAEHAHVTAVVQRQSDSYSAPPWTLPSRMLQKGRTAQTARRAAERRRQEDSTSWALMVSSRSPRRLRPSPVRRS